MARIESPDAASYFELAPVHVTRARGDSGENDGIVCGIRFESYGEPINGEANLTRGGLTRMIARLRSFAEKQTGMMQLRAETAARHPLDFAAVQDYVSALGRYADYAGQIGVVA